MSKTILITGASTGIGAECAVYLAQGNTIFIHYNQSKAPAETVAALVEEKGGTAHVIQADLSTQQGCEKLYTEVAAITDHLDVLVNNAGGLVARHEVKTLSWELMEQIYTLNTYSTIYMTHLCIPLLEKGTDPNIINMTSVAARNGAPTATLYGSSKGALDSFTRGAARELAPTIRVNAIAPGVILTPFHEKFSTPEKIEVFRNASPLKRNGVSEHIATAVQFLIENDFMTGETIDINGGVFMR
ncbi:MAG: SDR family oxidoreductase [Bacteroidetes bacterium]|nr:SDR family oxidoreductase [Bacteroidota bacterium]MCB0855013.1 SDR family oxidoreductase [Bacteroidota bacterium]